jgi:hypothetical protein
MTMKSEHESGGESRGHSEGQTETGRLNAIPPAARGRQGGQRRAPHL